MNIKGTPRTPSHDYPGGEHNWFGFQNRFASGLQVERKHPELVCPRP